MVFTVRGCGLVLEPVWPRLVFCGPAAAAVLRAALEWETLETLETVLLLPDDPAAAGSCMLTTGVYPHVISSMHVCHRRTADGLAHVG